MRTPGRDRGALAVPGIVKIAIALAVLGVLGYDGFETVATHLKAEDDAQNAAYAASQAWEDATGNQQDAETAYQAALAYLAPITADHLCGASDPLCPGVTVKECTGSTVPFCVDSDGTVHLVVRRVAKTLVFSHLGFMHHLLVAYEQGDANESQD